jgi:hypothetical protein
MDSPRKSPPMALAFALLGVRRNLSNTLRNAAVLMI